MSFSEHSLGAGEGGMPKSGISRSYRSSIPGILIGSHIVFYKRLHRFVFPLIVN